VVLVANASNLGKGKGMEKTESGKTPITAKLPPIPPPPKPSRVTAPKPETALGLKTFQIELKKQGKDLLFTQSEISKLFAEIIKNRERIKSMEGSLKELSSSKAQAAEMGMKSIDEKVSAQLEKMDAAVRDSITKSGEELDKVVGDLKNLKSEIEGLKKLTEVLNTMDISGIRRDIESLKTKSKWLEQQIENVDIEPLYELIKEIEGRVSYSRTTSPVIIE